MKTGMMWTLVLSALLITFSCKKEKDSSTPGLQMEGLVLNEISGSQNGWVELYNPTGKDINISGLKIILEDDYYANKRIYTASAKTTVTAGAYKVLSRQNNDIDTDIKIASVLEISLVAADGTVIDVFTKNTAIGEGKSPSVEGSFSRLPNGSGSWFITKTATPDEENFGITNRNALWMWSTHAMSAPFTNLANNGIGHLLLNEEFFRTYTTEQALVRIDEAEKLGLTVHVWFQCFYSNGVWISPVDDDNQRYDQELFDAIIHRAEDYVRMGIKGIHFDYIRFGGTAPSHNYPEKGVTAEGAITEFCRQVSEAVKRINKHVILSAALMPERSLTYYYGQNPEAMGQYLDILMPMIYRYSEGGADKGALWAKELADFFAQRSGKAEVWAGITTYKYSGNNVLGLTQEQMLDDCRVFVNSSATGIVLFRFGLGSICDLSHLWD